LTLSPASPPPECQIEGSVIGHTLGVLIDDVPEYSGKEGGPRTIMDALNRRRIGQHIDPSEVAYHHFFSSPSPPPVTGMDDGWHRIAWFGLA
jgi:hypothetical protein